MINDPLRNAQNNLAPTIAPIRPAAVRPASRSAIKIILAVIAILAALLLGLLVFC